MLDQTVHGKDSFRGYISRGDPLFNFGGAPFLRQLSGLGDRDITYDDWRPLVPTVLYHYRIGYVILERARLEEQGTYEQTQQLVRDALGAVEPAYADAAMECCRGALIGGQPPAATSTTWSEPIEPLVVLGDGWHEVEDQAWRPFGWMQRGRSEVYVILPAAG